MNQGPDVLAELSIRKMQKSLLNFHEIGVTKRLIAEKTAAVWPSESIVIRRPFQNENTRVLLACVQKVLLKIAYDCMH